MGQRERGAGKRKREGEREEKKNRTERESERECGERGIKRERERERKEFFFSTSLHLVASVLYPLFYFSTVNLVGSAVQNV